MSLFSSTPTKYKRGTISVCRRGKLLIVALDRPKVKNALIMDSYSDLVDLLTDVENDDMLAGIILTGTGNYFSSGADVKESFQSVTKPFDPKNYVSIKDRSTGKFMIKLLSFNKILAGAVNGPTVGIAAVMLMHFDIVYFSNTATFWAPFSRLALIPEFCSSVTLAETMGLSKANELLLLGKKITAQTALDWNICSQIRPEFTLDPFAAGSLASIMCQELEKHLLSLPVSDKTANVFVTLIRGGKRRQRLLETCRNEFEWMDKRFLNGDIVEAASQLKFGKSKL